MSALRLWQRVEQMLFKRGINTVLEVVLWAMLFYIVIGVVYAVFHIELLDQLASSLSGTFPIFADIAALIVTIVGWPFLWGTSLLCGVAGCGMF
jgi:hypothetical protein